MKKAFTLAEVLITLGIIGIVAAMTLPTVKQKIDKQITVSKLKKSFATMYEIIRLSEKDNGEVWEWPFEKEVYDQAFNESDFFKKYFESYIKKVGTFGNKSVAKDNHEIYSIDGLRIGSVQSWAVLPDGSSFGVFYNPGIAGGVPDGGAYMWVFLDINAKDGPNRLGKDIFITELVRNKRLIMWGSSSSSKRDNLINNSNYPCKKGTNVPYAGGSCGALIQADGWQIKDDYPW